MRDTSDLRTILRLEDERKELIELLREASPYVIGEMAYPDEWLERAKPYLDEVPVQTMGTSRPMRDL